jgi:hypothetical protein
MEASIREGISLVLYNDIKNNWKTRKDTQKSVPSWREEA